MINLDEVTEEIRKKHNQKGPQIPDYSYRILIIRVLWSGKKNSLFNLRIHKPEINKNYLYAQDLYEAKYHLITSKIESICLKYLSDFKNFI